MHQSQQYKRSIALTLLFCIIIILAGNFRLLTDTEQTERSHQWPTLTAECRPQVNSNQHRSCALPRLHGSGGAELPAKPAGDVKLGWSAVQSDCRRCSLSLSPPLSLESASKVTLDSSLSLSALGCIYASDTSSSLSACFLSCLCAVMMMAVGHLSAGCSCANAAANFVAASCPPEAPVISGSFKALLNGRWLKQRQGNDPAPSTLETFLFFCNSCMPKIFNGKLKNACPMHFISSIFCHSPFFFQVVNVISLPAKNVGTIINAASSCSPYRCDRWSNLCTSSVQVSFAYPFSVVSTYSLPQLSSSLIISSCHSWNLEEPIWNRWSSVFAG